MCSVNVALIDADAPTLLTVTELARWLGVSHTTITNWDKDAVLPPPHVINGRRFWQKPVIDKWLEKNKKRRPRKFTD